MFGIQYNEAVYLSAAGHGTHGLKYFVLIFASDDRVDILPMIAELADATDGLQIKSVLIHIPGGGRENDADDRERLIGLSAG